MPARKSKTDSERSAVPVKRIHPKGLIRRAAHGVLVAVSFQAAQFGVAEAGPDRLFGHGLLDRLKEPLTRYHE